MLKEIRCPHCNKKLCECNGVVVIKCQRCKNIIKIDTTTSIKEENLEKTK